MRSKYEAIYPSLFLSPSPSPFPSRSPCRRVLRYFSLPLIACLSSLSARVHGSIILTSAVSGLEDASGTPVALAITVRGLPFQLISIFSPLSSLFSPAFPLALPIFVLNISRKQIVRCFRNGVLAKAARSLASGNTLPLSCFSCFILSEKGA